MRISDWSSDVCSSDLVTFPRNVGQVPLHYDMKNTGRPIELGAPGAKYVSRYLDAPNTPLYPFGYGLSYTSFSYSPVTLDKTSIRPGEKLTASVTVTNSGARDGEEVVTLYVRDLVGSVQIGGASRRGRG